MNKFKIECIYVDSCYPDYLQDHHNRDNEQLLNAAYIQRSRKSLVADLVECFEAFSFDKVSSKFTTEQVERAIKDCIDIYPFNSICKRAIDLDMEDDEDILDEYVAAGECYVYVYLTWD